MTPLQIIAVIFLVLAFLLTALGGMMDMSYNEFELTRQHLWNDGIFLGIAAIAILLIDIRR